MNYHVWKKNYKKAAQIISPLKSNPNVKMKAKTKISHKLSCKRSVKVRFLYSLTVLMKSQLMLLISLSMKMENNTFQKKLLKTLSLLAWKIQMLYMDHLSTWWLKKLSEQISILLSQSSRVEDKINLWLKIVLPPMMKILKLRIC